MTYGDKRFVAVGGALNAQTLIVTSPDGVTWTPGNPDMTTSLFGITYADSQFVAVGLQGTVLSSPAENIGVGYPSGSAERGTGDSK